jgi:hypothetical protein
VATVDRVYWPTDGGATFSPLAALAAGTTIKDLAVASDSSGATLYITVSVQAGYGGVWTCTVAPPLATPAVGGRDGGSAADGRQRHHLA